MRRRDVAGVATLQPAGVSVSGLRWQQQKPASHDALKVSMVLSICGHNITLNEQGAPVYVSLPLSLTAHMTRAAAAHYTFSCDGTAPLPLISLLSSFLLEQPVQITAL